MKTYNIIQIKYLSVTNSRGSRVKLTNDRLKESVTIPFDHALNSIEDMATAYLKTKGIKVIGQDTNYLVIAPINHTLKSIK